MPAFIPSGSAAFKNQFWLKYGGNYLLRFKKFNRQKRDFKNAGNVTRIFFKKVTVLMIKKIFPVLKPVQLQCP